MYCYKAFECVCHYGPVSLLLCITASEMHLLTSFLFTLVFSCSAGVSIGSLTAQQLTTTTCLFTVSRAWHIGSALLTARQKHEDPVKAVIDSQNGVLLISGKVIYFIKIFYFTQPSSVCTFSLTFLLSAATIDKSYIGCPKKASHF